MAHLVLGRLVEKIQTDVTKNDYIGLRMFGENITFQTYCKIYENYQKTQLNHKTLHNLQIHLAC